jgi:ribosome assembly protein YihI (activator of Der GTPase)
MPKSRPPRKPKAVREQEKRIRKPKGKPAGSRHNDVSAKKENNHGKSAKDPRIGSKKPVQLIADSKTKKAEPKKRYATPQKELEAIEADQKLMDLLDRQDNDETLTYEERDYVNTKLDRHKVLCDLLGISEDSENDDDPLAQVKPISPNDFR